MKQTCLISIILTFVLPVYSQMIPSERRIAWNPGIPGGIPAVERPIVNVLEFGADASGKEDSHGAFRKAIDRLGDAGGIVFVPEGTYILNGTLHIDRNNVVIRGAGIKSTLIKSNVEDVSIMIGPGKTGAWQKLRSGLIKGSFRIEVENGAAFDRGSFIEIQQDNDSSIMYTDEEWIQSWSENSVGQVIEVDQVRGNQLILKRALHKTFSVEQNPVVRPVEPVKNIGIEKLYIQKLKPASHTIIFQHAAYSWIKEVESYMTMRSHVHVAASLGLEISLSFFHNSWNYGGGGHGYGVECSNHTSDVLVENNIFDSLRHAMMVQTGANGNVFAYNYSLHPVQGEPGITLNTGWVPPDISVHGHYPYMNLFEGNEVMEIGIADYWGPAGPGNTFFRNKVKGEGIFCYDHSHEQNLLGNITTSLNNISGTCGDLLDHQNVVMDETHPGKRENKIPVPASLFLERAPGYFSGFEWPSFGPDAERNNILPARKRYENYDQQAER